MSVIDRDALEASPLADLHTIASELSIDGYRRLRKADLVDLILTRQGGEETSSDVTEDTADAEESPEAEAEESASASSRRRRGRRGGRGRSSARDSDGDSDSDSDADSDDDDEPEVEAEAEARPARTRSGRAPRGVSAPRGDSAPKADKPAEKAEKPAEEPVIVEGVVELLANGSGFVRVSPPEPSDQDVYISAAQVKRCELVSGDTVTGPRRAAQRSERFASLVRIDTINSQPASELADRARYDDLASSFPADRFKLAADDETLKAIEFLTPFGRGSRVTLVGAAWAGKSHTLKGLAATLTADTSLTVFVALAGVRPEELSDWSAEGAGLPAPAATLSFAASTDAQDNAVELVVDQAKRVATRGGDAVVLIDTVDGLHPHTARKALAAARNLTGSGSLTVIATASAPVGGETTVIALDASLTTTGRFPALDLIKSGTLRPELLVGTAGAKAIAEARIEAQGA
jgi:transcription termination factor Rho